MKIFKRCNHVWEIHTDVTESQMELNIRLLGNCPSPKDTYGMDKLTARKHIQVLTCTQCGKIKRYVTNI